MAKVTSRIPSLWEDFWKTVQSDLFRIGPPYTPTRVERLSQSDLPGFNFIDPRISRFREKVSGQIDSIGYRAQSRNGVTHEILTDHFVGLSPTLEFVQSCADTIPNKDYYLVFADPPLDNGGRLTIDHSTFAASPARYESAGWVTNIKHEGFIPPLLPSTDSDGFPIWDPSSRPISDENSMVFAGTRAWNISRPAKPSFDLGVFIGELKDAPSLIKFKLESIKSVGDFFLLEKFGWENLLRDIRDMWKTYCNVADQLEFLIHNNGKVIRRRFQFPLDVTSTVMDNQLGVCGLALNSSAYRLLPIKWDTDGYLRLTKKQEVDTYFTGSFIFYLNGDGVEFNDTPQERLRLTALLYGAKITPATVWELIPWSWLSDYFLNIGDIISNATSQVADRQLTNHAYLMRTVRRIYTREGSDGYLHASFKRYLTSIYRRKVDPYGLANNVSLTDNQSLILAALGLSRV